MSENIVIVNSDTTLDPSLYSTYLVDATPGNITITLPLITADGTTFNIKRIDGVINTVTIVGTSGQTIDSSVSLSLSPGSNFRVTSLNDVWYTSLWNLYPGSLAEADFYAVSPPDDTASISAGNPVPFPNDGVIFGNISRASTSSFTLGDTGTYRIRFQTTVNSAAQLGIELNGVLLANTVVGTNLIGGPISGDSLVSTTAGSTIRIVYPAGNLLPISIAQNAGGVSASSSHLVITKVR